MIRIAFLISYIVTNLAMVKWSRESGDFDPIRQGFFGLLGAAILLYPLWKNLSPWPEGTYGVLPWVYLAWIGLGIGFLLWTRARRPDTLETAELRGNTARLLSSYPDHPGLLFARAAFDQRFEAVEERVAAVEKVEQERDLLRKELEHLKLNVPQRHLRKALQSMPSG